MATHLDIRPVCQGGVQALGQLRPVRYRLVQRPHIGSHGEQHGSGLRHARDGLTLAPHIAQVACAPDRMLTHC